MTFDADEVGKRLQGYLGQLRDIHTEMQATEDFLEGWERLSRWRDRVSRFLHQEVSIAEGVQFDTQKVEREDDLLSFLYAEDTYQTCLKALVQDIQDDPDYWRTTELPRNPTAEAPSRIETLDTVSAGDMWRALGRLSIGAWFAIGSALATLMGLAYGAGYFVARLLR